MLFEDINILLEKKNQRTWNYWNVPIGGDSYYLFRSPNDFISDTISFSSKKMLIRHDAFANNGYNGLSEDRARHSLSTYFLGILISNHFEQFSDLQITKSFDFSYFWNLICLFHDYGYCFEEDDQLAKGIRMHLAPTHELRNGLKIWDPIIELKRRLKIDSSIWKGPYISRFSDNQPELAGIKDYYINNNDVLVFDNGIKAKIKTYSSTKITKYFNYQLLRKDDHPICDHGIVGGYLFFDSLLKNYLYHYNLRTPTNISEFKYNNLNFSFIQFPIFAYISSCIMSHNIYCSNPETEHLYRELRLECFLEKKYPKINYSVNPYLFLLAIVDTIEPIKIYKKIQNDIHWSEIINSININSNENYLEISTNNARLDFVQYFNQIKSIEKWVNVKVDRIIENNTAAISIKLFND